MEKKKAIIVDLDDCLFDSRCMSKYFPKDPKNREQWDYFQSKIGECSVNKHILELLVGYARYNPHITILFVTSRENRGDSLAKTLNAIDGIFQAYKLEAKYMLFMRPENCYDSSAKVKKDIYSSYIDGRCDVIFAIDDEEENIKMFKELGINTLQCRYGDEI